LERKRERRIGGGIVEIDEIKELMIDQEMSEDEMMEEIVDIENEVQREADEKVMIVEVKMGSIVTILGD